MGNVLEEVWTEEGGIRLRISEGEDGRCVVQVIDTTPGWPGTVVATATIARFRLKRVAAALAERSEPFAACRFVVHGEIFHAIDGLTRKFVYREVAMLGTDDRKAAEGYAEDFARRSGRRAWVVDRISEAGEERP